MATGGVDIVSAAQRPSPAVTDTAGLNWSELYAIVGSLFESNMSVPQHLAMLEHLPSDQRCAAGPGPRRPPKGCTWPVPGVLRNISTLIADPHKRDAAWTPLPEQIV